jgi:hypothetical protein
MIAALGAQPGMFAGVVTAAPAFAGGRGDGWQVLPLPPAFTAPADHCGFPNQGTHDVATVFTNVLKTAGGPRYSCPPAAITAEGRQASRINTHR